MSILRRNQKPFEALMNNKRVECIATALANAETHGVHAIAVPEVQTILSGLALVFGQKRAETSFSPWQLDRSLHFPPQENDQALAGTPSHFTDGFDAWGRAEFVSRHSKGGSLEHFIVPMPGMILGGNNDPIHLQKGGAEVIGVVTSATFEVTAALGKDEIAGCTLSDAALSYMLETTAGRVEGEFSTAPTIEAIDGGKESAVTLQPSELLRFMGVLSSDANRPHIVG
jgi:hypothetical protein